MTRERKARLRVRVADILLATVPVRLVTRRVLGLANGFRPAGMQTRDRQPAMLSSLVSAGGYGLEGRVAMLGGADES